MGGHQRKADGQGGEGAQGLAREEPEDEGNGQEEQQAEQAVPHLEVSVRSTAMSIHPTAIVDGGARLGEGVVIGPCAVVEDEVTIGARTELRAHAVVKRYTTLGAGNTVHEGAVLGSEPQDLGFTGGETRLEIGDGNRIREGVTIHRATRPGQVTRVGSGCFLMAYAHIAHDNRIGDQVIIANNTALAGYVEIDTGAFLSGGVVVHQFCRIGRLAMIGGNSKLIQDALCKTESPVLCVISGSIRDQVGLRGRNVIADQ